MNMTDDFHIGDWVKFDILGTDIKGEGEILAKGLDGVVKFWIVSVVNRDTEFMEHRPERALLIQENFIQKVA